MVLKQLVYARTRFVGFHQWADAPECYKYLANVHRHEFHVEIGVQVKLSNREVEFHHLKAMVDAAIRDVFGVPDSDNPIKASCETMASMIAVQMRERFGHMIPFPSYVDVSEDGECGGRVEYE